MVLVTDGRIYRRIPDSEVRQAAATVADAGTAAARPDAGTPARSAAAAPAAGAADAGPQQFLYVPGGPMPPGMVPETSAPDAGGY